MAVLRFRWERFSTVPTVAKMQERMEIRSELLTMSRRRGVEGAQCAWHPSLRTSISKPPTTVLLASLLLSSIFVNICY